MSSRSKARYLLAVQHEIAHLSELVDDLFELAQLDAGLLRLNLERASLYDLLSDTLATFGPQAQRQGVRLIGDVQGAIDPVLIDPLSCSVCCTICLATRCTTRPPTAQFWCELRHAVHWSRLK